MQGTRTAPILRRLGLKRAHVSACNSRSGKAVVGGQVISIGITDRELTTGHSQLLLYGSGGGELAARTGTNLSAPADQRGGVGN